MNSIELNVGKISYTVFGEKSKQCIVVETAMGASCAEWWHIAHDWSKDYCVIVYDRMGYGLSGIPKQKRTPENRAKELNELLIALEINKIILVGHSIGGLYAYQFSKLFPEKLFALILVDPVSPYNGKFKKELSKKEYKKSGVDKSINLKYGKILCSLGLGGLLVPLLKKSPPFYYYNKFSMEAEKSILRQLTGKKMYTTAIEEYSSIENDGIMKSLEIVPHSLSAPLYLICHSPEIMKKEIEYYGNADSATALKIENLWLDIMKEYLKLTKNSCFMQAKNSGHLIHLTDPDIIKNAIDGAALASHTALKP